MAPLCQRPGPISISRSGYLCICLPIACTSETRNRIRVIFSLYIYLYIQWRQNERYGVSNHRRDRWIPLIKDGNAENVSFDDVTMWKERGLHRPKSITNHSLVVTSGYISNRKCYKIIPLVGSNNMIFISYIITYRNIISFSKTFDFLGRDGSFLECDLYYKMGSVYIIWYFLRCGSGASSF